MRDWFVIEGNDAIRWLYYRETGQDPGPLIPTIRDELKLRYLTDMWPQPKDVLEFRFKKMRNEKGEEAEQATKQMLTWVLRVITPFIRYQQKMGRMDPTEIKAPK